MSEDKPIFDVPPPLGSKHSHNGQVYMFLGLMLRPDGSPSELLLWSGICAEEGCDAGFESRTLLGGSLPVRRFCEAHGQARKAAWRATTAQRAAERKEAAREVKTAVTDAQFSEIRRRLAEGVFWRNYGVKANWAGEVVASVLGLSVTRKPDRRRVIAILDKLIAEGRLGVAMERNAHRQSKEAVIPVGWSSDPAA